MPEIPVSDLFDWLSGVWTVQRTINHGAGAFTGTARFSANGPDRLRWEERGRLTLEGHCGPASRVLELALDAGTCAVNFDDGRLFHYLNLSSGHCAAKHVCGADSYHGDYVAEALSRMTITWHVTGPARNDVIQSRYRRQASW